jgi:hypothetical protein
VIAAMVRLRIGVVDGLGRPPLGRQRAGQRYPDDVQPDPVRAARVGNHPDIDRPARDPQDLPGLHEVPGGDPGPAPQQHALAERARHRPYDHRQLARPGLHPRGGQSGAHPVLDHDAHHLRDDPPAERRPPYGDREA